MSEMTIPLPPNFTLWRNHLFTVVTPIALSTADYEIYWPSVDSVYSKLGGILCQQNGTVMVQKYECRLRKSKKSGTRPPSKSATIKRRQTSIRDKDLCKVRVKVTRCIEGADEGRVVVERMDAEMHTHDIEASFRIKKPSMVRRVLESECAKGGRPAAEIFKALKGAKTGDGLSWLETAGGASLKRQDVVNIRRVTTVDTPAGAGGVDEEPDDEGSVDDGVVGEYLDPAKPFRVYAGGFGDPELVGAFATLDEANRLARDAAAEYIAARFHQAPYESSVGRVVEAAPELELPQFSIQDVRPEVEEVVVASVPEESAGNRVWVMAERLFLDGDYGKPGGGEVIMGIYGDVSSAYAAMGKWYNDADRTIFKKETRKCEGMADEVIMVKYGRRKVEVVRIKEHNVE